MKHKKYVCDCCKDETTKARFITTGHLLCDVCNMKLIYHKQLRLNDYYKLKITGKHGDFYIVQLVQDTTHERYWADREKVYLHAQMDNQSTVGWDVHESY